MANGIPGNNPPRKNSLIRLSRQQIGDDFLDGWFHVNVKAAGTLKLRQIPNLNMHIYDDINWDQISEATQTCWTPDQIEEALGIPKSALAAKFPESLISVVRRIEGDQPNVIPVTSLRCLYEWMREKPQRLPEAALHAGIAESFAGNPKALAELFLVSLEHFNTYENETEPFIQPGRQPLPEILAGEAGTNAYVGTLIQHHGCRLLEGTDLECLAVARELSPWRSTAHTGPWVVEDGRPSDVTGDGGIDLLLKSEDSASPVVGEVKVGSDTTPFFALVQVMAYASELLSSSQRRRLSHFHETTIKGPIDLYLLLHDVVDSPILDSTRRLAGGLINLIQPYVRRIVFVRSSGGFGQPLVMEPEVFQV